MLAVKLYYFPAYSQWRLKTVIQNVILPKWSSARLYILNTLLNIPPYRFLIIIVRRSPRLVQY